MPPKRLFLDANILVTVLCNEYPRFGACARVLSLADDKRDWRFCQLPVLAPEDFLLRHVVSRRGSVFTSPGPCRFGIKATPCCFSGPP